jgi:transcriptional regulator with XRE-family HTH domain
MTNHEIQQPAVPPWGQIHDGLEAAERAEFTRPVPKGAAAQFRFLLAQAKGSTAAVAARLGTSRRTVQRYAAGKLKRPNKSLRAALAEETARDWQPGVRARAREQASAGGLTISLRATFGYHAALGSTNQARPRQITQKIPPAYAAPILAARENGATESELHDLVAQALCYAYFQKFGTRATSLEKVVLTDVDYIEFIF